MRQIQLLLLPLLACGCVVGPNYYPPEVTLPDSYVELEVCDDEEDLVSWWTLFDDPFLSELLQDAVDRNLSYNAALEQIRYARAQYLAAVTQLLPEFMSNATASHYRGSQTVSRSASIPSGLVSPIQDFFQLGFDAVWELDFFGGLQRGAEAAFDTWEASEEAANAVYVTLLAEVAQTYLSLTGFQAKTDLARQRVEADEELLALARSRFQAGLADESEVSLAEATLEIDRQALFAYETLFKQGLYSLVTLVDWAPADLEDAFAIRHPIPVAVGKIPAGVPGDLMRRRPDVRQAERQLAAATAEIGVAVAQLFPTFSLTGSSGSFAANPLQGANAGWASAALDTLFRSSSAVWGIGTFVSWPVFDFGRRWETVGGQVALQQQAYYNYQQAILTALQEVEQGLSAYHIEERRLGSLEEEVKSYRRAYELALSLYKSGLGDYTQVLSAKSTWLNAQEGLADSQQVVGSDLIALYKALGGDWPCSW